MSWSSRRISLVLAAAGLLGVAALLPLHAQRKDVVFQPQPGMQQPNPNQPKKDSYDLGRLTLPKGKDEKDEALKDLFDAAEERVKEKEWERACMTLQKIVGRPEDVFVQRERRDKDGTTLIYVSAKKEAARVIGALPKDGLTFYVAKYGQQAYNDFRQARTTNNFQLMTQVMALYLHTPAGAEACDWLATHMLDRANFGGAASFYYTLLQRSGLEKMTKAQLVKAAYAFHQSGDTASQKYKADVLKELERRNVEIPLGGEQQNVAAYKQSLDKFVASVSAENASDVPVFGGRPSRNTLLPGGTPFLQPSWTEKLSTYRVWKSTRPDAKDRYETNKTVSDETDRILKAATDNLAAHHKPIFGAFHPVTATAERDGKKVPMLLYRTYNGVAASDIRTGMVMWDTQLEWSFGSLYGDRASKGNQINAYTQWLGQTGWTNKDVYVRPQIPFDNSVTGTLSADQEFVYAVEDLVVPPPQNMVMNQNPNFGGQPMPNWGPEVAKAIRTNKLIALRHYGGKAKWELGGADDGAVLKDSVFLGPPLPLNGKLYVLNEKQQDIRLVTIEPKTGKVLATQLLASTRDTKLEHDPLRRVQACHIAHSEGILVVPTNAGAVFGLDLFTGTLAWAYPYAEQKGQPNQVNPKFGFQPLQPGWMLINNQRVQMSSQNQWLVTAPRIQDGKAVFSAPDSRDVHCVNLRDGERVWTMPRDENDLYVAGVFGGKVVIVGRHQTRALLLSNGQEAWKLDTGLPSGIGAASTMPNGSDTLYYLPLREATNTRQPEICAINVDKGMIHAHTRSRKDGQKDAEVPGNLVFYEGNVLSQSHEAVTAYPQLEVKLTELNNKLKGNEEDPTLLTERGDYLLDRGDLLPAITDFRKALRHKDVETEKLAATKALARTKLYESYTEYFQRDFNKAEVYLKDYEDVCTIDTAALAGEALSAAQAENRRRRANYLCLVGKGREAQDKLVDAFRHYLELGEKSQKGELIQVVDEPSVKAAPDVWSQGRIASMIKVARADSKAALEEEIRTRWERLRSKKDAPIAELRNFVALFGSLFGVGRDARFSLAERLMEDDDVNSLLEAEQHLTLLRTDATPAVAARAYETLGRLNTRKGLLEDAAYFYRILGDRFPKVDVNGKPGADYLDDLATDKRFLPYLDQAARFTLKGRVDTKAVEEAGSFYPNSGSNYPLHNFGEGTPFFTRHRLVLDTGHNLKLIDAGSGEVRWTMKVGPVNGTQFHNIATTNSNASRAQFGFQTQGHLVVVTLGHMLFAVDPLNKGRVVWERNLSQLPNTNTQAPYPTNNAYPYDQRDGSVFVTYTDGSAQRLGGQTGALQGGVVCVQTRDSLSAVDPVTGRTLWARSDVNSRAHVFGDDDHIYVVNMGENNTAAGTRVFRSYDGVSVRVPDFSALYEKRVRLMGRHLLAADTDGKGVITMRIYDVLTGKDLFRQTFPNGSVLMQSEDPRLAGVVAPAEKAGEGKVVRVIDVVTQREVVSMKLDDPKHGNDPTSIHLLSDPDHLFIAFNGKMDGNVVGPGGVSPNYAVGQGMRSVPVNGEVYCFDRASGRRKWFTEVPNQHLIITGFDEVPCLFFTSRYQEFTGGGVGRNLVAATKAFAILKHNGKVWWMPKDGSNTNVEQGLSFHSMTMDHRTGKVELIGSTKKIHLTATPR